MYRLHYDLRISYKHLLIIVGNNDKQMRKYSETFGTALRDAQLLIFLIFRPYHKQIKTVILT